MKEGWVLERLGELCKIINGGTPKTGVPEFWGGPHLWLTPAEMGRLRSPFKNSTKRTLTDLGLARSSAQLAPAYSVILSTRAPIGHLVINTSPMATNQGCKTLVPDTKLEYKYLFYYLYSIKKELDALGEGATFKELSATRLKKVEIPFPQNRCEQQRIVAILDAAFADIATAKVHAERNLANALELFDAELQRIFTVGKISWNEYLLCDMASEFGRGKSKHRPRNDPKLYGGRYPFIQTGDVRTSCHIINTYSQTYNELGLAQSKIWPKGTVCITIAANIAETCILGFDSCFPDSIIGFVPNTKKSNASFVEYLLNSFKIKVQSKSKGSAQQNINLRTFETLKFPFPSVSEQKNIVARLDELSAHCKKLEALYTRKIALYDELKQSLLAKAFRGELC